MVNHRSAERRENQLRASRENFALFQLAGMLGHIVFLHKAEVPESLIQTLEDAVKDIQKHIKTTQENRKNETK